MPSALFKRASYPTLEHGVYFNQAALGLIGQPAVEAMHAFLDTVARHGSLRMSDTEEATYAEALRARAARLLHAEAARIAIVGGASELLGQLPLLLQPGSGSTILAVSSDFPAVTRPWLRYAAQTGCTVRFVDDTPAYDLTDVLLDTLDARTAVVAVSSVQYATGTRVDIPRLRAVTAPLGVSLIVDATQAAGALRVDTTRWDVDVIVTSGYKWLGGHGGVALAVIAPDLLVHTPPLPGWMGAPDPFAFDATRLLLAEDARRYTQSTMSYVSMAGLTAALDALLALDADRLEAHARALAAQLIDGVAAYGWHPFRRLDDAAAAPHIISLAHPTLKAEATATALRRDHIVCGARLGRLRISLAPYNDDQDIDALIDAFARQRADADFGF